MSQMFRRTLVTLILASSVAACSKPTFDDHVRQAEAYVAGDKLAEGALEYRLALQIDPRRADVRLTLSDLYLKIGDRRNALDQLVRAADLQPDNAATQIKAGELLLASGAFEDARARAQKALEADPKNADAQVLLGNSLANLRDFDAALKEYQQAIALNPDQDDAYVSLGVVQLAKGDRARAEQAFRQAVAAAPDSIRAQLALAGFLWSADRRQDAEAAFKAALAIDPKNSTANRALGTFYLASGRGAEAEPYFQALADASTTPDAKFALADYYVAVRRNDDARKILNEMTSEERAGTAATMRLAAIETSEGLRAAALDRLNTLLEAKPRETQARLLRARIELLDGRRDEAVADANAIVTDAPNTPAAAGAYAVIGGVERLKDRKAEAIAAFEQVMKLQPRPLGAAVALANLYLSMGDTDPAATYARQALAIAPGNPEARVVLVRVALMKGDVATARRDIAALRREYPNAPVVMNLLAAQQLADRNLDAAASSFEKSATMAPNDLEALAGLIQVDLAAGRRTEAITRIEAALEGGTPSVGLLMLAGRTYATTGDMPRAEELLKKAIEQEPARLQAYGMLAQLYLAQRRVPEAQQQFERLIELDPKSVGYNTMLGMLLDYQKRPADAAAQYEKVLAIDPSAPVAANNLAWIYVSEHRNLDVALQLAQTAQRSLPDEPNVNDTLGWIYYQRNLLPQAIRHLELSVKNGPRAAGSHLHLGMAYAKAGENAKARASLLRALEIDPNVDGAAEARETLARIGGRP
ncbi:MAG: tetratricopeptide repeat protein [Vicinamibacterales bacterium]